MKVNWKLLGTIAGSIVVVGFTGTTIIFTARYFVNKKKAKKAAEATEKKEVETTEKVEPIKEDILDSFDGKDFRDEKQ